MHVTLPPLPLYGLLFIREFMGKFNSTHFSKKVSNRGNFNPICEFIVSASNPWLLAPAFGPGIPGNTWPGNLDTLHEKSGFFRCYVWLSKSVFNFF